MSTPSSASTESSGCGSAGYQTSVSMPLRTTCTRLGSSAGIGLQHVVAHARADRDHRVGGLDRGALHPRRHPVAAAELLGLPRPHRLQRMGRQHVRDPVQQRGQVTGQPGVPGVRVHHRGGRGRVDHHQVRRQRRQCRVGALERRIRLRDECARPRCAHAVHVHLAQVAQLRDELGDVHARAAVDLGWVLPSHHRHPHGYDGNGRRAAPLACGERRCRRSKGIAQKP